MGIDHKDFMHGAALVAIADCDDFTALNKASVKYGHYVINHDRNIFIKYSNGDGDDEYAYTFQAGDKKRIAETAPRGHVYAVFVCGTEAITGLTREELSELVDLDGGQAEWVKIAAEPGKRLRFWGSRGELSQPIARNAFPLRILT